MDQVHVAVIIAAGADALGSRSAGRDGVLVPTHDTGPASTPSLCPATPEAKGGFVRGMVSARTNDRRGPP